MGVEDPTHKRYLQAVVAQNLKKIKDFFKKYPTAFEQKKYFLDQKTKFVQQLNKIQQNVEDNKQSTGGDWKYIENQIILKSKILCATLSMSGVEKFDIVKDQIDFLIVDEAC